MDGTMRLRAKGTWLLEHHPEPILESIHLHYKRALEMCFTEILVPAKLNTWGKQTFPFRTH